MNYTETQVFELMRRLTRIYLESFPNDREQLERYLKWAHRQFGYEYQDDKTNS